MEDATTAVITTVLKRMFLIETMGCEDIELSIDNVVQGREGLRSSRSNLWHRRKKATQGNSAAGS
jgi:hypothetical protein